MKPQNKTQIPTVRWFVWVRCGAVVVVVVVGSLGLLGSLLISACKVRVCVEPSTSVAGAVVCC